MKQDGGDQWFIMENIMSTKTLPDLNQILNEGIAQYSAKGPQNKC